MRKENLKLSSYGCDGIVPDSWIYSQIRFYGKSLHDSGFLDSAKNRFKIDYQNSLINMIRRHKKELLLQNVTDQKDQQEYIESTYYPDFWRAKLKEKEKAFRVLDLSRKTK